jgi:hypothetical protein
MSFLKLVQEAIFGKRLSTSTKRLVNNCITKSFDVVKNGDENAKKALVVEMDGVLGKALNDLYGKNSVGANLKKAKPRFKYETYQKAWDAHKLRNKLVHEPGVKIDSRDMNMAVSNFVEVLKALK